MKKAFILSIISIFAFQISLHAQETSLRLGVGYGFPLTRTFVGTTTVFGFNGSYGDAIFTSYGAGFNVNAGFTKRFKSNIGLDLEFQALFGKKIDIGYHADNVNDGVLPYNYYEDNPRSTYANAIYITPSVVFFVPVSKFEVYGKLGVVASISSTTYDEQFRTKTPYDNSNPTTSTGTKSETTGKFSLGFRSAIGIMIPMSQRISIFGEVSLTALNFIPDKKVITASTVNGSSNMSSLTVYQRETVFVKGATINLLVPIDQTKPSITGESRSSMSSVALQAGVSFKLSKVVTE
ncbi:MAG: hypothetical protein HOP08_15970 [Cyclobacteriaceae bacterium]|nr:hypothetical protein [Cyclobacteriaceae bacterium]